jgi:hypothetical protein
MDTEKFKSIALSMPVYLRLKTLSQKKFPAPVSMAKIVEMEVNKAYAEFMNGKKVDEHRP